jgi:FAS-associated factor 2
VERAASKVKADRAAWRRYARKHLLSASLGAVRIAMRTPLNANRNVRQFTPGDSTEELFIYAETLLIPDEDAPESDPDHSPLGYVPPRDFVIVTSYPRKEVPRLSVGGAETWDMIRKTGGALFAEKAEGSRWGERDRGTDGDSSEEEIVDDSD